MGSLRDLLLGAERAILVSQSAGCEKDDRGTQSESPHWVSAHQIDGSTAGRRPRRFTDSVRFACSLLATAVCYYVATQIAWSLCFPNSKVSLFFPPHAVLVAILLLVPTRHWWAYVLAAGGAHFLATQLAHWPTMYALHAEAFDAVQNLATAAGIRIFIKSPLKALTLRDAIIFVLIAVILCPFVTAFWGAAFTVSNGFGTDFWIEWRNLGVSNAVTAIVLVPALLLGAEYLAAHYLGAPRGRQAPSRRRVAEAALLVGCMLAIGYVLFHRTAAGPETSPALLFIPIPLLIWAALRFGLGGISVAMLIMTFQAIAGTMRGHGPFITRTPEENALALQSFLLMTATPLMMLAVMIEQERRAKQTLRERNDLMGLAAEAANAAMWVWDVGSDVGWMTAQGRSMLGLKPDERVNYPAILERVHPDDREVRARALQRALETRGEYDLQYRVLHPDGVIRWLHVRGRCVEANDGSGPKLFGVSMDVTARKEAEASAAQEHAELQRQRAQLEHVARVATLGELTATLTHEMKQPLNAIRMRTTIGHLLLDSPQPELPELRSTLSHIDEIAQRASSMIDGMRDMLKRATPGFAMIDLNQLIRTVEHIVYGDAILHRVKVRLELAPVAFSILGDNVQLQQVLLNLMLNAFSAMNDGGLNVPRRLVVRTQSIDDSNVLIEVMDSGTGIAPDKLDSIFDPFITSKPDGLGMGLSICRTIIERHGGKIWAVNNPERGATFSITLPIAPAMSMGDNGQLTAS